MIVEEITAMSILAVKNTPNSLKYMQKHINLWSQFSSNCFDCGKLAY